MMVLKRAVRRAIPLQLAFTGPTNSGKTMSALLFAAGLAGPKGRVAIIETEPGRGSLYAANKRIMDALPQGYEVLELGVDYHPRNFIEAIDVVEKAGVKVCLIDNASDEWDGPGGCNDIKEQCKGRWNLAKLWNKRFVTRMVLSNMHTICCLKAQEKSKIVPGVDEKGKKTEEYISLGMLPVCEKNFFYPMLLGFSVDPTTHVSTLIKGHDELDHLFDKPHLITKADGEKVRQWNEGGAEFNPLDRVAARARAAAQQGMDEYQVFWTSLTPLERKELASQHAENKTIADRADAQRTKDAKDASDADEDFDPVEEGATA